VPRAVNSDRRLHCLGHQAAKQASLTSIQLFVVASQVSGPRAGIGLDGIDHLAHIVSGTTPPEQALLSGGSSRSCCRLNYEASEQALLQIFSRYVQLRSASLKYQALEQALLRHLIGAP
jgi:hypothetical protein